MCHYDKHFMKLKNKNLEVSIEMTESLIIEIKNSNNRDGNNITDDEIDH